MRRLLRRSRRVPQLGPFIKLRNRLVMLGNYRYVVTETGTRYRDGHVVVQLELVPESVALAKRGAVHRHGKAGS